MQARVERAEDHRSGRRPALTAVIRARWECYAKPTPFHGYRTRVSPPRPPSPPPATLPRTRAPAFDFWAGGGVLLRSVKTRSDSLRRGLTTGDQAEGVPRAVPSGPWSRARRHLGPSAEVRFRPRVGGRAGSSGIGSGSGSPGAQVAGPAPRCHRPQSGWHPRWIPPWGYPSIDDGGLAVDR